MTWRRQAVVFMAIGVALVGILPFANPGCQNLFVLDSETGELRPATPEEVTKIVDKVGDVARIGVVAIGRPEWLVFVDVAVRVAALAVGFLALTTSGFMPTVSFGWISCLTLLGGLVGNLVVLPVLLTLLAPRPLAEGRGFPSAASGVQLSRPPEPTP